MCLYICCLSCDLYVYKLAWATGFCIIPFARVVVFARVVALLKEFCFMGVCLVNLPCAPLNGVLGQAYSCHARATGFGCYAAARLALDSYAGFKVDP